MSQYTVIVDHAGTYHQALPCATWSVAFSVAKLANRDHPGCVRVFGDDYDVETFPDGSRVVNDGLSEGERAQLIEAGVLS